jgi:Arc/MetJ family transcription regulator
LKSASFDAAFDAYWRTPMRTTIALDDELLAKAQEYTGIKEKSALVHEALRLLVARETGRRLAAMGGSDPTATAGPRRRSEAA